MLLGCLQRKSKSQSRDLPASPGSQQGGWKSNRAACPLLGGHGRGLGAAGMYMNFISESCFPSTSWRSYGRPSPRLPEASLSHCPALGLAIPCPCSPYPPFSWQEREGRNLQRSDAAIPGAAPQSAPPQPQDVAWIPSQFREGRQRDHPCSQIFTLGRSPFHLPKGQAGPHSAGR